MSSALVTSHTVTRERQVKATTAWMPLSAIGGWIGELWVCGFGAISCVGRIQRHRVAADNGPDTGPRTRTMFRRHVPPARDPELKDAVSELMTRAAFISRAPAEWEQSEIR